MQLLKPITIVHRSPLKPLPRRATALRAATTPIGGVALALETANAPGSDGVKAFLPRLERAGRSHFRRGGNISGRTLAALAAGIPVVTVSVRLVFAGGSNQSGQSHLWQWPQFIAMFALGGVAARRGWLDPIPADIRRACGRAALGGLVAFAVLAETMAATGTDGDVLFERRWHWAPLTLAAIEGPLAIGACLWLLGLEQHHLDRPPGPRHPPLGPQRLRRLPARGHRPDRPHDRAATRPGPGRAQGAAGLRSVSRAPSRPVVTRTSLGRIL
jgi:hypothetical protein